MKTLPNFININKNIVDFVYISENIHMTCTLALSHRLAYFLEPTGANRLASGVFEI